MDLADTVKRVRSGVLRIVATSCDGVASGTGVIVAPHFVVTVEHVIDGATTIALQGGGHTLASAQVIGVDTDRDLALLYVKQPLSGHVFSFEPRAPRLGEEVAVLGYPLDLPLSVTRGTVSGLGRTIAIAHVQRRSLIQTDAAVNPGNSGGPLLSTRTGEVVGLVDLGSTRVNGIAFAVSGVVARSLVSAWKAAPQPHPLAHCVSAPVVAPTTSTDNGVGVPTVYEGRFTSVDRLERCLASDQSVFCTAGPSSKAVKLVAGERASDRSPYPSRDLGGPSMPEGTSFTTPGGTIKCESSSRGITCTDTATSASFTIGDYSVVVKQGSTGGTGARFKGYFASIDRLERCYLESDFASCTAGPSGKGVSLSAGGSAVYEGVTGSSDHGGEALSFGRSVSAGTIRCESSGRGISCRDSVTGNGFVIGDHTVVVRNNGQENKH
jgi:hypothetical protein